jgi:hypothetical protein
MQQSNQNVVIARYHSTNDTRAIFATIKSLIFIFSGRNEIGKAHHNEYRCR